MGAFRVQIAKDLDMVSDNWEPLWVVDFPMFEYDEQEKRYVALHHPFTAPKVDDESLDGKKPRRIIIKSL